MQEKSKLRLALELFWVFFRIGAFTFGGGYAMISLIKKETVENKKWIHDEDILDIVAIAESTPGPIAINSSTFIGYKVAGVLGAFFATLGVVLPSFFIILVLSFFIRQFESLKVVKYAFTGIRAGILALLVKAFMSMGKACPKNVISYAIAASAFAVAVFTDVNVLFIIIASALVGLVYSLISERVGKARAGEEK